MRAGGHQRVYDAHHRDHGHAVVADALGLGFGGLTLLLVISASVGLPVISLLR